MRLYFGSPLEPAARITIRKVYRQHREAGSTRTRARGEAAELLRWAMRPSPRFVPGHLPPSYTDQYTR